MSGIIFICGGNFQFFLKWFESKSQLWLCDSVTRHNEMWREMINKIAPALISGSFWINKMSVPETKQYRSIEDIYLNIGDRACRKMCLVLLLLFIQNIQTHKLNHTDLEPRYRGEGPFAPTWVIFVEDKVLTYWLISLAGTTPVSTHFTTSTTVNPGNPARDSSERSLCAGREVHIMYRRVSLQADVVARIILYPHCWLY